MYLWNPKIFASFLPYLFYTKLLAQELLFIALFSFLTFLILRIFFSFVFFFNAKLSFFFCILAYALIVTIYVFSWMQFLTYGRFINLSSIEMFVSSPFQILEHANDIVAISIYRIATIPVLVMIALYLSKKYVLVILPNKALYSYFLLLNIICALINVVHLDSTPYTRTYIKGDNLLISTADLMRKLRISAASPFITIKESTINLLTSNPTWQAGENVKFTDILPPGNTKGLLRESNLKNWDVIIMEIESLNPQVFSAINPNLQESIMPTVDSIAANSQLFTKVYAQSSHSSYADLVPLSSQYPLRSMSTYIYPANITYPKIMIYDVLSEFGYKTAIISSQNEEWQGMNNYLRSPNLDVFIHAGNYQEMLSKNKLVIDNINTHEMEPDALVSFAGKLADSSTISIINSWVSSLKKEQHYFLYTNLQNSHNPFYSPADREPRFFKSKEEEEKTRQRLTHGTQNFGDFKNLYNESLSGIDEQIQVLVEHLKNLGRWNNTLLVITADTSTHFSESIVGNGAGLFEDVLHVPLIIKVPGEQGKNDTRLMQHLDITPTVLGYMGMNEHPGFQGKDFSDDKNCNPYSFAVAQTPLASQYSIISDEGLQLVFDVETKEVLTKTLNDSDSPSNLISDEKKLDDKKQEILISALNTWVAGQISYYNNGVLMTSKYPPKFSFSSASCN